MQRKQLEINASTVYERNREAFFTSKRIISNRGGARSTKTFSILQLFVTLCFEKTGVEYDVVRKTLPSLRATAYKDFLDIIKSLGLYDEKNHNKSELTYQLRGNTFNFYSIDNAQKIRGRKRDHVLLNEVNELGLEDFRQISLRTTGKIFMDYNPSDEDVWVYDVERRDDAIRIDSTYTDNPFLGTGIVTEIERLKTDDPDYWQVYGLGQIGKRREIVFTNWDTCDEFPTNCDEVIYGMDFGFNDPKVFLKLGKRGNEIFIHELLYERELIRADLIQKMPQLVERRNAEIYADSEDPETIADIHQNGYNIKPSNKEKGSVLFGIEALKAYKVWITATSLNLIRDWKNYKWKMDKNGKILDEPAHTFSHGPDAARYPVYTHWGNPHASVFTSDTAKEIEISEMEAVTVMRNF